MENNGKSCNLLLRLSCRYKKENFDNSQNIILKKYLFLYIYSSENILIWILDCVIYFN